MTADEQSSRVPDTDGELARDTLDVAGLSLPPTASRAEAAAIVAALGVHVREERTGGATDGTNGWQGERFAFAGRVDALTGDPRRIPLAAPTDNWTAASRLDRV